MTPRYTEMELETPTARDFLLSSTEPSRAERNFLSFGCFCTQDKLPSEKAVLQEEKLPIALYFQPFSEYAVNCPGEAAVCPECGYVYTEHNLHMGFRCACPKSAHESVGESSHCIAHYVVPSSALAKRGISFVLDITSTALQNGLVSGYSEIFTTEILECIASASAGVQFFLVSTRVHFLDISGRFHIETLHSSNEQCIDYDFECESQKLAAFFAEQFSDVVSSLHAEEQAIYGAAKFATLRPLAEALLLIPSERVVFVLTAGPHNSELFETDVQTEVMEDNENEFVLSSVFEQMISSKEFLRNAFFCYVLAESSAHVVDLAALAQDSGGFLEYYEQEKEKLVADVRRCILKLKLLKFDVSIELKYPAEMKLDTSRQAMKLYCSAADLNVSGVLTLLKHSYSSKNAIFQAVVTYQDFEGNSCKNVITAVYPMSSNAADCVASIHPGMFVFSIGRKAAEYLFSGSETDHTAAFCSARDYVGGIALETTELQRILGDNLARNDGEGLFESILRGLYGLLNSNLLMDAVCGNDRVCSALRMQRCDLLQMARSAFPLVYRCDGLGLCQAWASRPDSSDLIISDRIYYIVCENKRGSGLCLITNSQRYKEFSPALERKRRQIEEAPGGLQRAPSQSSQLSATSEPEIGVVCERETSFGDLLYSPAAQQCLEEFLAVDASLADSAVQLLDLARHAGLVELLLYEGGYEGTAPFKLWTQNLRLAADKIFGGRL